jgi:RHS repeat-associated protein
VLRVEERVPDEAGREVLAPREYSYDQRGNVVSARVPNAASDRLVATTYAYDASGYLVGVTEPGGIETTYATDASGLVTARSGPHPLARWEYRYDAFGQLRRKLLKATESVPEAKWEYAYRLGEATVQETDPLGYVTERTFNASHQLLREVKSDRGAGRSSSNTLEAEFTYDGPYLTAQETREGSGWVARTERPRIDDRGRVLEETESWRAGTRSYSYQTETGWSGRVADVTETWDTAAPVQVRRSTIELDSLGNTLSREQGGITDLWTFDAAGAPVEARPNGRPETAYELVGGVLAKQVFDPRGVDPEETLYGYFPSGRLRVVVDPSGRRREATWNDRGLLETVSFGRNDDFDVTAYGYDRGGQLETVSRGGAPAWSYANGPRGELLSVTQPGGLGEFTYRYDARNQLASIDPPPGGSARQTFQYDYLGRLVDRTRGAGSDLARWQSDWSEGESTTIDPNSDATTTLLDSRGRVAHQHFSAGGQSTVDLVEASYDYDGLDQALRVGELRSGGGSATVAYGYDARSRLESIARGTDMVSYGYTPSGQRWYVRSPAGQVTYTYDQKDRLLTVTGPDGDATTFGWERGGERIVSIADETRLRECREHDRRGRLIRVSNLPVAGTSCDPEEPATPYARFDYSYDDRNNRLTELYTDERVSGELTTYAYDAADRLVGVQYPGGETVLYGLGGDGSRACEKRLGAYAGPFAPTACADAEGALDHLEYAFDGRGGLRQVENRVTGELTRYATDAAGRVRSEARGSETRSYEWDPAGRLLQVSIAPTVAGGGGAPSTSRYTYDHAGRRISKQGPSGDVEYLWGAGELIEERLPSRTVLYQHGAGMTVAAAGERLMHDALGSTVGRVGASTMVVHRYDAWGSIRSGNAPAAEEPSVAYAGQHWDPDAGLSYAQQRWYDPRTGRFLSEDRVFGELSNPTSLHAFGYANGNPLRYTDSLGLMGIEDLKPIVPAIDSCHAGPNPTKCEEKEVDTAKNMQEVGRQLQRYDPTPYKPPPPPDPSPGVGSWLLKNVWKPIAVAVGLEAAEKVADEVATPKTPEEWKKKFLEEQRRLVGPDPMERKEAPGQGPPDPVSLPGADRDNGKVITDRTTGQPMVAPAPDTHRPSGTVGDGSQAEEHPRYATYIPPPRTLPGFPDAERARPKTPVQGGGKLRARWKDKDGNIYEWDYQEGAVEKYDPRGRHQGEFDPNSGEQTKPPNVKRRVKP